MLNFTFIEKTENSLAIIFSYQVKIYYLLMHVKVGPPIHNYEREAGSYGDGFT